MAAGRTLAAVSPHWWHSQRHSLRGDFEACGPAISPEDLRAYLNEAKAQSSDYYVGMLVDDLLVEVDARYPTPVGATDG